MLPTRIRLTNFLSHEATEIDYTGCHLVALAGENGAGKSALAVDALTWCLWGEARGRSDDDLVRQGADECEVEVEFEAGGQLHGVVRRRRLPRDGRAGVSALAFQLYGPTYGTGFQDLTRETIRETQEAINAACGMDYKTFSHTACLIQGQADQFTTAAPGARKDVLVSLLGLTAWQGWAGLAHERLRASQADIAAADASLAAAAEELQRATGLDALLVAIDEGLPAVTKALEDAEAQVATWQGRLQEQAAADAQLAGLLDISTRQRAEVDERAERILQIGRDLASLPSDELMATRRQGLVDCDAKAAQAPQLRAAMDAYTQAELQRKNSNTHLRQLQQDLAAAERDLDAVPAAPADLTICPTCEQPVEGEAHEHMVEHLLARRQDIAVRIDGLELHIDAERQDLAAIPIMEQPDAAALAVAETAARTLPDLKATVAAAEERLRNADNLRQQQAEQGQLQRAALDEIERRTVQINSMRQDRAAAGDAKDNVATWQAEAKARQAELDEQMGRRHNLEGQLEAATRVRASAEQARQSRAVVAEYAGVWEQLEATFGPRGIQAMLIDAALPQITDEANRLLALMASGTTIELTTQRAGKTTGRQIETLDVIIADAQGTRPYENYSGGERFRIDFAIRIALSRLLARRAQAPCEVLIVDEGFGSQDGNGRTGLVEALATVKEQFRLIEVISHIDDLREMFPQVITVTKTATGSRASLS